MDGFQAKGSSIPHNLPPFIMRTGWGLARSGRRSPPPHSDLLSLLKGKGNPGGWLAPTSNESPPSGMLSTPTGSPSNSQSQAGLLAHHMYGGGVLTAGSRGRWLSCPPWGETQKKRAPVHHPEPMQRWKAIPRSHGARSVLEYAGLPLPTKAPTGKCRPKGAKQGLFWVP